MVWYPATYGGLDSCNVISVRSIRTESFIQSLIGNGPLCEYVCVCVCVCVRERERERERVCVWFEWYMYVECVCVCVLTYVEGGKDTSLSRQLVGRRGNSCYPN